MNIRKFFLILAVIGLMVSVYSGRVGAADNEFVIVIKDHKFFPAKITVPASTKIKLIIENQDVTPEEFESFDLNREKVVSGNGKITIFIGPLKPGKYSYFGDFHQTSAQGTIIAE